LPISLEDAKTRRVERFILGSSRGRSKTELRWIKCFFKKRPGKDVSIGADQPRVDPDAITLSLIDRFKIIGDELIRLDELARVLVTMMAGLTNEAVVERFKFAVRRGFFRSHEPGRARDAVKDLLNLNHFWLFEPTQYPLRPSIHTAATAPHLMFARRSVWVRWIQAEGWSVPPALIMFDAKADEGAAAQPMLPPVARSEPALAPHDEEAPADAPPPVDGAARKRSKRDQTQPKRKHGNTKYDDTAAVEAARAEYAKMSKPAKLAAARTVIADLVRKGRKIQAISQDAWVERIRRQF
jgi:hypothetical protein